MSMTLSYSSANVLLTCATAYKHHKVLMTPKDREEDQTSFRVGKAFHSVMELTNHDKKNFSMELFEKCLLEQNVFEHRYTIYAMIHSYYSLHKASGLDVISVERKFENEYILGYIDAIMVEPTGFWWVVDLKTSASIIEANLSRLTHDTQLNLYAAIMQEYLAKEMGLDLNLFAGCRYRVAAKSKLVVKENETLQQYAKRVDVKCLDVEIPLALMPVKDIYEQHKLLHKLANEITADTETLKNRNACFNYNKPCDFFSQCYGAKLEDMFVKIYNQDNIQKIITKKDEELL